MSANKAIAVLVTAVLLVPAVAPVATATSASSSQAQAYTGTHVTFETTNNAVVDYAVNGDTVFQSMKVQSKSAAQSDSGIAIDAELSAVTGFTGAAISVNAKTTTSATITTESGAKLTVHDNRNGILVVRSGSNSQYVAVNVSESAQVETTSEGRVVVHSEDGTTGTFLVVGDGSVTVNDQGNITAELSSDSKLVFRSYPDGRDQADKKQEQLIAQGKAVAEVYVMEKSESSSEMVVDVVQYGQATTVKVTETTKSSVTMTVDRSKHKGKVIITSVSKAIIESTEDMQVTIAGNAAVRASSYSELRSAIGGDTSKFLVQQQTSAKATADVLVAVNHFSERQIKMQDSDSSSDGGDTTTQDGDAGGDGDPSGSTGPGFGIGAALVAVIGVAIGAYHRA